MSGRAATDTIIPGRHALSVGNPGTPVPPGWAWLPLGQLAEMGTGHTPSRSVAAYWDGDVPWMGIRDARIHHGGTIWDTVQTITQAGLDNSSARLLPAGTVALSRTASVGYVVQFGRTMATSQDFVTWTCNGAIESRYLMKAIEAEGNGIRAFGEGSTHTTIYFPELKAIEIKTPPVLEQRRIISKIESLLPRSKRAHGELQASSELLKNLRNSILDRAFADQSYRYLRLDELAKVKTGATPKRSEPLYYSNGNIPWVTSSCVNNPTVTSSDQYITDRAIRETNCKIFPRDTLIIAMYGEGQTRGKVSVLGIEAATNQAVAAIIINDKAALSYKFLYWFLFNQYTFLRSLAVGGVQPNLNLSMLKSMLIPFPEPLKQKEIVCRIEHCLASVDRLTAETQTAQDALDKLDQAILAKAFRGELVPQDPNDEPASVLLERIRAERAAAGPAPKRGRRPRGATA